MQPGIPSQKNKIMIVDDEPLFQELMQDIFRNVDVQLTIVLNGFEALDCPKHDLYIIDQGMPKMDGLSTLKALKEKFGEFVPAILITGYDTNQFMEKKEQYGIAHILQKPFDVGELIQRINEHFNTT